MGVNTKGQHPQFFLRVEGEDRSLHVGEETREVRHRLTVEEQVRQFRSPWSHIPETDQIPAGLLRLEIGRLGWNRADVWVEERGNRLEKRLPSILAEVVEHTVADRAAQLAERKRLEAELAELERQEAERRSAWEVARAAANVKAIEARRRKIVGDVLQRWEAADRLRRLAQVMEQPAHELTDSDVGDRRQWLVWLIEKADELDPTLSKILERTAFKVSPTDAEIEVFMGELSVRGPGKSYRSDAEDKRLHDVRDRYRHWWRGRR